MLFMIIMLKIETNYLESYKKYFLPSINVFRVKLLFKIMNKI
jgi:hypothetical protein